MESLDKFLEDKDDLKNNIKGLLSNFVNEYPFVNEISIDIPTITIALGRKLIGDVELTINV